MDEIVQYIKNETGYDTITIEDGRICCYFPQRMMTKIPNVFYGRDTFFFGPKITEFINSRKLVVPIDFIVYVDANVTTYKTINGWLLHYDNGPAVASYMITSHVPHPEYGASWLRHWYKNGEKCSVVGPNTESFTHTVLDNKSGATFGSGSMKYVDTDELLPREIFFRLGGNIEFKECTEILDFMATNSYVLTTPRMDISWLPPSNKLKFSTMISKLAYDSVILERTATDFTMICGKLTGGEVFVNGQKYFIKTQQLNDVHTLLLDYNIFEDYFKTKGDVLACSVDLQSIFCK